LSVQCLLFRLEGPRGQFETCREGERSREVRLKSPEVDPGDADCYWPWRRDLFRIWGLGFRIWGLGFRVAGLGFGVQRLGLRVEG